MEPAALAAWPTMILNDELEVEMMRDIDERAFCHIYRLDSEDARTKNEILEKNFLRGSSQETRFTAYVEPVISSEMRV